MAAAGVMCVADDKLLLMRRVPAVDNGGVWAFPAGGIEAGESAKDAAIREVFEETGHKIAGSVDLFSESDAFTLFTNKGDIFIPAMNEEHDAFMWTTPEKLPEPLHSGIADCVGKFFMAKQANDSFAFDKSVRTYDQDGRLRVSASNISKANVCEYLGEEIPDWESMGLDPKRLYKLYRDPQELAKAAQTFNGLPILNVHVPSTSWDHPKGKVVGATGTDSEFNDPYLANSLFFWTDEAIKGIETDEQRELSCGYRYRADMTPGRTPSGEAYDGVMRDILGNHVAVVAAGRAGSDVIVGDSKLETTPMTKKVLSHKAALAKGALMASIKLAQDKKLDLDALLVDVTEDNWKDKKQSIVDGVKAVMAKDADISSVVKMLDMLDGEEAEMVGEPEPGNADDPDMNAPAVDGDPSEQVLNFLKGKISDEDCMAVAQLLSGAQAAAPAAVDADQDDNDDNAGEDADPNEEDDVKKQAKDEPAATPGTPAAPGKKDGEELVSKSAMDAAVRLATDTAEKNTIAKMQQISVAEQAIHPYVGKLAMSFDSAEAVYKAALETMGLDVKSVHPSAYRHILEAQKKPGDTKLANDAKVNLGDTKERFPDLAAVRNI